MNKLNERFIALNYDLCRAVGYVSETTGEFVEMTWVDKALYALMKSRHSFFVLEKKGDYYDTQEEIAKALYIDRKTAQRRIKIFMDNGVVIGKKVKSRNYLNWQYHQVKNLKLWIPNEQGEKEIMVSSVVKTKPKDDKPKSPKPVYQVPVFDDESDLPF